MVTLLWFSRDLRLSDNPALIAAVARGRSVIPVFILDDTDAGEWAPGGASRWWLHGSLDALSSSLRERGSRLILRRGKAEVVISQLLKSSLYFENGQTLVQIYALLGIACSCYTLPTENEFWPAMTYRVSLAI